LSFNSLNYAVFFPLVFFAYWSLQRSLRIQNLFVVIASYAFYAFWDYRFLLLIVFSTGVDYFVGIGLSRTESSRARLAMLATSVTVNLGLLAVFKYCGFFVDSWIAACGAIGVKMAPHTVHIVLPVGISFYTFQTMSYTLDVYRRRIETCPDGIAFAAFVSFFPQLVAGPIERASNLLPQFLTRRKFDFTEGVRGVKLIVWGLFKKIVVADNCGVMANHVFKDYEVLSAPVLFLGAFYFGIQIYCDFSAYSDIARGSGKLLGIELMVNFRFPYFSRDIAEFWRRWHISLTTWFRDYCYIPLGGSRAGSAMATRNVFIIFIISGLWHGANWTFIIWGVLNALLFVPLQMKNKNRTHLDTVAANSNLPSLVELAQMSTTFILVTICWVFFRADNLTMAMSYLTRMTQVSSDWSGLLPWLTPIPFVALLIGLEWICRFKESVEFENLIVSHCLQLGLIICTIMFGPNASPEFIYFQF
jgi:alginate O-acetyltransferase complex protein AlgI